MLPPLNMTLHWTLWWCCQEKIVLVYSGGTRQTFGTKYTFHRSISLCVPSLSWSEKTSSVPLVNTAVCRGSLAIHKTRFHELTVCDLILVNRVYLDEAVAALHTFWYWTWMLSLGGSRSKKELHWHMHCYSGEWHASRFTFNLTCSSLCSTGCL